MYANAKNNTVGMKCVFPNIRRVFLCLFLGAITTVAVAWFFAAFFRPQMGGKSWMFFSYGMGGYQRKMPHMINWGRINGPGRSINTFYFHDDSDPANSGLYSKKWPEFPSWVSSCVRQCPEFLKENPVDGYWCLIRGEGWPFEAMWCECERSNDGADALHGGISLPLNDTFDNFKLAIPLYLILWPGFLVDVAFYTLLWFALISVPRLVRRKRREYRIRNNRCPACGYDLRGSSDAADQCPECGSTIGVRKKANET